MTGPQHTRQAKGWFVLSRMFLVSFILVAPASAFVAACSQSRDGVVVMKINHRVAHISYEPGTAKKGDSVALIQSRCPRGPAPTTTREPSSDNCKKCIRGVGVITEILSDRYATAEFPGNVGFEEGDAAEPGDGLQMCDPR